MICFYFDLVLKLDFNVWYRKWGQALFTEIFPVEKHLFVYSKEETHFLYEDEQIQLARDHDFPYDKPKPPCCGMHWRSSGRDFENARMSLSFNGRMRALYIGLYSAALLRRGHNKEFESL